MKFNFPNHVYVGSSYAPSRSYPANTPPNWSIGDEDIGPHVAIIDEYSIECLDRLVTGEITSWDELEAAEMLCKAIIMHDILYLILPAVMTLSKQKIVYANNNTSREEIMGSVFNPHPIEPKGILSLLKESSLWHFPTYSSWIYLEDNKPISGDPFWIEHYNKAKTLSPYDRGGVFESYLKSPAYLDPFLATPYALGCTPYISKSDFRRADSELLRKHSKITPKKVLNDLDARWRDELEALSSVGLNLRLGPFLTMVLSKAGSRREIPEVLLELRQEMEPNRKGLWMGFDDVVQERRLKVALRKAEKISKAFDQIVPASFPRSNGALSLVWNGVKTAYEVYATGNVMAGINFIGDKLLSTNSGNQAVSVLRATKSIKIWMRNSENISFALRKHLTDTELRSLDLI